MKKIIFILFLLSPFVLQADGGVPEVPAGDVADWSCVDWYGAGMAFGFCLGGTAWAFRRAADVGKSSPDGM